MVSPDVIAMIIALFAFVVTTLGGIFAASGHLLKKLEARFEQIDKRFEQVDGRSDDLRSEINRRFERVENELVEIKVAIARLEGPERRLQRI